MIWYDLIGNNGLADLEWEILTGESLFSDNFEDGDYDGWNEGTGSYTREVTDETAADGSRYSISLTGGSGTNYDGVDIALEHIQPTYVGFYTRPGVTSIHDAMFVLGGDDTTSHQYMVYFYADNNGYFHLNSYTTSVSYEVNIWYHIEFKNIDWTNKTFDCHINDDLIVSGVTFRDQNLADLTQLHLFNYLHFRIKVER